MATRKKRTVRKKSKCAHLFPKNSEIKYVGLITFLTVLTVLKFLIIFLKIEFLKKILFILFLNFLFPFSLANRNIRELMRNTAIISHKSHEFFRFLIRFLSFLCVLWILGCKVVNMLVTWQYVLSFTILTIYWHDILQI